jgi:AraC-like DNA-binding protein
VREGYAPTVENTLLQRARRFANAHADENGIAQTPIPGLALVRETAPSALQYAINRPLVAMVLQGSKRVTMGRDSFESGTGQSLLITADIPTVSQITRASVVEPYLSLIVDLDPVVIAGLVAEMDTVSATAGRPLQVDTTEAEVADAALRLMRLLDQPTSLQVLQHQLMRELHFWLLSGRHGGAIRNLGMTDSHARRIARAVALIRENFARPLSVGQLAEAAAMGVSSFHEHFRAITSLTPLQFQKQLRLIEARRKLLADGEMISNAAYAVGYESVPQFTREYGRLFGMPPARDMRGERARSRPAA